MNALMFLNENGNNLSFIKIQTRPKMTSRFRLVIINEYKRSSFSEPEEDKHILHLHCNATDKARSKLETRHTANSHEYDISYL